MSAASATFHWIVDAGTASRVTNAVVVGRRGGAGIRVKTIAKAGRYDPISIRRGLSDANRERYFDKQGRIAIMKPEIREAVEFRRFNLLEPMDVLGTFDLVLMRNVMLYFSAEVKRGVLRRVLRVLRPEAAFAAGASEMIESYSPDYTCIRDATSTYYRAKRKQEGEPR